MKRNDTDHGDGLNSTAGHELVSALRELAMAEQEPFFRDNDVADTPVIRRALERLCADAITEVLGDRRQGREDLQMGSLIGAYRRSVVQGRAGRR